MNIIIIGPNGSGKGVIAGEIKRSYDFAHIEVGGLFQYHIRKETKLGIRAREYVELGELVPAEITIPMIMDRIQKEKYYGWILDGFPRTKEQAIQLEETLRDSFEIDIIIELFLDYEEAKRRISGRRTCIKNRSHPNNVNVPEMYPHNDRCHVCGEKVMVRSDDKSDTIMKRRHYTYYDSEQGTLAAACYLKSIAGKYGKIKYLSIDASPALHLVSAEILSEI